MNALLKSSLALAALAVTVSAQVPEPDFQSMKWSWGPVKWLATKAFEYAGDYGYYQDNNPSYAIPNSTSFTDWRHWRFVYYYQLTGKRVVAWGDWGLPSVAPGIVRNGVYYDDCGHTHVTYGVWMQYSYYSGGNYYTNYVGPLYGGSKAGYRTASKYCGHKIGSDLHGSWGNEVFTFDFPKTGNIWQAMFLGGLANSHAGLCGAGSFSCINQPWLGAYTVAY